MRHRYLFVSLLFVCLIVPSLAGQTCDELPDKAGSTCKRLFALLDDLDTQRIRVIIGVSLGSGNLAWCPEGELSPTAIVAQRNRNRQTKENVVTSVTTTQGATFTKLPERDYATLPYFVAEINKPALIALLRDIPSVTSVEEPHRFINALAESTEIMGAKTAHRDYGVRGLNQTVVIFDGGVEKEHPFLKGRVLTQHEACFSSSFDLPNSRYKYTSLCGAATPEKPYGTAEPCVNTTGNPLNCGHGTRVAGVAAGNATDITGVAPAATILPILITSKRERANVAPADSDPQSISQIDDIVAALEYVATLAGNPKFKHEVKVSSGPTRRSRLAVNISQVLALSDLHPGTLMNGYSESRAACNDHSPSLRDSVKALAALDVPVIAATGNKEKKNSFSLPACIEDVIAVSATRNDDTVPDYANVAEAMDLFAPGGDDAPNGVTLPGPHIRTSEVGGGYTSDYGTSLAAPHVTGAFALLREADPFAPFDQLRKRLIATGKKVIDQRGTVHVEKPRIDVAEAIAACDYSFRGAVVTSEAEARTVTPQLPGDTVSGRKFQIDPGKQAYLVVELRKGASVTGEASWTFPGLTEVTLPETTTTRKVFRADQLSSDRTFIITVQFTDTRNGQEYICLRTIAFRIIASNAPILTLTGGMCDPTPNPIIFVRENDIVVLKTHFHDESGKEFTDLQNVTYEWKTEDDGQILLRGTGETYRNLEHIITGSSSIRVTATIDDLSTSMLFTTLIDPRPRDPGLYIRKCKVRSIRSLGQPISSYTFADGEVATFEVPEIIAGATYEWRSRTNAGTDEHVGTGTTHTTGLLPGGRLYVLTTTSDGETQESEEVLLISNAGSTARITITPAYQSIPAAGTARITAAFTPVTGALAMYEWRKDSTYDTSSPVIGGGPTLTLVGQPEGGVYWCRVIETKPGYEMHYYSRFASVNVRCSPQISGSILVTPSRVAKNQAAQLFANTDAKQATHQWYRFLPNETPTATGSDWYVMYPFVNAAETKFRVQVTDVCGTSGTLNPVSVFLCVPTINTQPAPNTIAAAPPKLTIAVEPAISGQALTVTWHRSTDPNQLTTLATGLEFTPTQSAGTTQSYYAAIRSTCGGSPHTIKSSAATVEICAQPVITSHTPLKETKGEAGILVVNATGTELTYQWYRGDKGVTTNPLAGKTDPSLSIAPSVTTNYWVRIKSRGVCSIDSPTMTIKVCALPVITTAPQSTRVFPDKTATLNVAATNPTKNSDPLKYAWFQGTSLIAGATSAMYTTPPITATTTFSVEVSSGICKTTKSTATVSLCAYPEVVSPSPSTWSITSGSTVLLTLPSLSPALPKTVTWYRGAPLDRSNPVSSGPDVYGYTTPPLTATTQYWAEFDESGCVSRTSAYTVNVCKPTITAQPQNATVPPNAQHTLSVTATPATGLTYQWYTGPAGDTTNPISGATSSSYTTPALTATTTHWARVSGCTSVNSTAATVTVCAPPAVTSITKIAGDTYNSTGSVTVEATGTSLLYQWYRGQSGDISQPITGATSSTYTFTRKNSEYYWARVRSSCTTAIANSPAIFATVDPVITTHPQSMTVPSGGSTTLSVAATGTYLTYQWYQGTSTAIAGATNPTYTTPALTTATSYWCKVTSGGLSTSNSNTATVSICAGPDINSFSSTSVGVNSWRLTVNVAPPPDPSLGYVYHWYSGTRGNPAQSVDLGESLYYRTFYDLTQPTTYWVRVWWDDYSCYSDTAAKTLTPQ